MMFTDEKKNENFFRIFTTEDTECAEKSNRTLIFADKTETHGLKDNVFTDSSTENN